MTRLPLLTTLFFTVFVLGLVHFLALHYALYWRFPLIDIPMHMLGGISVAFSILLSGDFGIRLPKIYLQFSSVLAMVFIVGLLWEAFEVWAGVPLFQPYFYLDSVKDLIMDVLGGAIGYTVGNRLHELEHV
jgi:hypothetical protein